MASTLVPAVGGKLSSSACRSQSGRGSSWHRAAFSHSEPSEGARWKPGWLSCPKHGVWPHRVTSTVPHCLYGSVLSDVGEASLRAQTQAASVTGGPLWRLLPHQHPKFPNEGMAEEMRNIEAFKKMLLRQIFFEGQLLLWTSFLHSSQATLWL